MEFEAYSAASKQVKGICREIEQEIEKMLLPVSQSEFQVILIRAQQRCEKIIKIIKDLFKQNEAIIKYAKYISYLNRFDTQQVMIKQTGCKIKKCSFDKDLLLCVGQLDIHRYDAQVRSLTPTGLGRTDFQITCCDCNMPSGLLTIASEDSIAVFNVVSKNQTWHYFSHENPINVIKMINNGALIISHSQKDLKLWQYSDRQLQCQINTQVAVPISAINAIPYRNQILIGFDTGELTVMDEGLNIKQSDSNDLKIYIVKSQFFSKDRVCKLMKFLWSLKTNQSFWTVQLQFCLAILIMFPAQGFQYCIQNFNEVFVRNLKSEVDF